MLLGVVEPVPSFPGDDKPTQLVSLDPDNLIHPPVPPFVETLSTQLHGPTGDPQEYYPIVLQQIDPEVEHFLVFHGAVGQIHVDVPGRVGHDYLELAQHREVECAHVAVDPLALGNYCLEHLVVPGVQLLLLLNIVDMLAVGVVAGIQVGAVAY